MRYFNDKEVELLAPCGTFDIFKELLDGGADAFYCGGKTLNMRLHRRDYNLSDAELAEAVKLSHERGKKLYVTVNNLFNKDDIAEAYKFLPIISDMGVDGIIIQDLSLFSILDELGISIPLHSSVMMNVHNREMIEALQKRGISRIVASREAPLSDIKRLKLETGMEFEYFVHGDMCAVHGSQCFYSGMLFGKSSNRGMCMKPCRWNFKIRQNDKLYEPGYPMAVKDMCMYEHIPELIDADVTSFKIEGRMRDTSYIKWLVNLYGTHIDEYINDPLCYDRSRGFDELFENRKRDLSTCYAFGKPHGLDNINSRFEGTGALYSTGKVFSNPVEETETTDEAVDRIGKILGASDKSPALKLCVEVNNIAQAMCAIDEQVDTVYLSSDVFLPDSAFSIPAIKEILRGKKNSKIYLKTPRMMYDIDFSALHHVLGRHDLELDGLLATNLGAAVSLGHYVPETVGDYSLNVYNSKAADFYAANGLTRVTLSLELGAADARDAITDSTVPIEIVAHGRPAVMYSEHDLFENTDEKTGSITLIDSRGYEHPVYRDIRGRNHITLNKELCLLKLVPKLRSLGVSHFRIIGTDCEEKRLKEIIRAYKTDGQLPPENGFTLGGWQF